MIVATDIAEKAIIRSRENAKENNCEKIIFRNESLCDDAIHEEFDLVVANIPIAIIENNFANICKYVKPGGSLIVSGMSNIWRDEMIGMIKDHGIQLLEEDSRDEWICFLTVRIK
jgi:ribosomal protein L11 methyltransferase